MRLRRTINRPSWLYHCLRVILTVTAAVGRVLAADLPDTLIVEDYRGTDGAGDQGGFVELMFAAVADTTVTHYRVFREMTLNSVMDDSGNVVELDEPVTRFVSWASVPQVETDSLIVAIVPTIDNKATRWGIRAEADTTGERQIDAQEMLVALGFVAATIDSTAEVAFDEGVVELEPVLPSLDDQDEATMTLSESARAIDDIPPAPITGIRYIDGGRVLQWGLSPDDRPVGYIPYRGFVVPIPGVIEYLAYRGEGNRAELIGDVPAGVDSLVIQEACATTSTWQVQPRDSEHQTEGPALAVFVNGGCGSNSVYILAPDGPTPHVQDFDDFLYFASSFMKSSEDPDYLPAADTNGDGVVDFTDFLNFAGSYNQVATTRGGLSEVSTKVRLRMNDGGKVNRNSSWRHE